MASVPEFVIPSERDQLLESHPGIYKVKKVFALKELRDVLTATKPILQSVGPNFVLEHFDEFFSLLVHGPNAKLPIFILAFERLYNCLEMFVNDLENQFDKKQEPRQEDKPCLITISKMLAYLFHGIVRHVEVTLFHDITETQGKRKKNLDQSDPEYKWHNHMDKFLVLIYQWVSLPLENLWRPPIADNSFITCIADTCYRILERCKTAKDKAIRESIFQVLGVLTKRYQNGISCVIKVVQLVKMCDGMANHLAKGMVQLIEETQCTGIVREILSEVNRVKPEEGRMRDMATFLEGIASSNPKLILPVLDKLIEHLSGECYMMRNCVIGILGTVVKEALTSEDLSDEENATRDKCLKHLTKHLRDVSIYVRSKVVCVWQSLSSEGAIPIAKQNSLLEAVIFRVKDKSSVVRKHSYHLLRTLLQSNPFAARFDQDELREQLRCEEEKLKTLKIRVISISKPSAKIRQKAWDHLAPAVRQTISETTVPDSSAMDTDEDFGTDAEFETVRQLILDEKIREAVQLLMRINSKVPGAASLDGMPADARENYLLPLLYKIFMDSQETWVTENDGDGDTDTEDRRKNEKQKREKAHDLQNVNVDYAKNCSTYADRLTAAIPIIAEQLCSTTVSDAIESCSFIGLAYQFKIKGAEEVVRAALCQVFYPDASVCENLADVYKQIYIGEDEMYKTNRQKGQVVVRELIKILRTLKSGESPALTKLVVMWRKTDVLSAEALQIMWEKFALKSHDSTPEESRAALMLLTMAASEEPAIVKGNFDVLVEIGLGPRAETDLLLVRDTCRAMTKVQVQNPNSLKCPARLPNDHTVFQKLLSLLLIQFSVPRESCYPSFSIEAINVIYHLADHPEALMKELLVKLSNYIKPSQDLHGKSTITAVLLANLFNIVGHVAIKEMVHLDMRVYRELSRRSLLIETTKQKKSGVRRNDTTIGNSASTTLRENETPGPSRAARNRRSIDSSMIEDSGEAALEGAMAEDSEADFILNVLEHEVVTGDGLLAKFELLVVTVCQHPEEYKAEQLQIAAAGALSKMMTVSSVFCKKHLQLLITIMERSPHPANRSNILLGLTDMMNRFPNEVEPWTPHIYGRLRDKDPLVRKACIKILSSLIMKEMVRVKGQVSEFAMCLVDENPEIRIITTNFFKDLANKGNALYNIIPDILSRLTDPDLGLEEEKFQTIINFIFELVQKEKQVDSIIEKICHRFELATTERQWSDLSYCLSLLKFNVKSIRRLATGLVLMKDKVHHKPVLRVLRDIIAHAKKKNETKVVCLELEEKLDQMLTGGDKAAAKPAAKDTTMPAPEASAKKNRKRRPKF